MRPRCQEALRMEPQMAATRMTGFAAGASILDAEPHWSSAPLLTKDSTQCYWPSSSEAPILSYLEYTLAPLG